MFHLRIEDEPDRRNVGEGVVGAAVQKLSRPETPPTYIVVTAADKTYCQAAGSSGRFIAELRECFGEGFTHWRAGRPGVEDETPTTIYYRYESTEGKHSRLGCPLSAIEGDVLPVSDVQAILKYFASTGEKHPEYRWREITEKFLEGDATHSADDEILDIRPGSLTEEE
jgi:hypothetical protein